MRKATVICDASFYKHPRNSGTHHAGWAAWVRIDGMENPVTGYGILGPHALDSTLAEMYAALNGVWIAARHGATQVLVRSDCTTVCQAINGRLKAKRLVDVWEQAMHRPDMRGVILQARHVKGHGEIKCAATYVNDWCDRKAKFAQKQSRKGVKCLKIS